MNQTQSLYIRGVLVFSAIALLVFAPLFGSGYILSLDLVWAPGMSHVQHLIEIKGPLYYGRFPFVFLLDTLGVVVPLDVLEKLVLMSVIVISGLAGIHSTPAQTHTSKFATGLIYAVNPFVYTRFLAGHWYLLLSYAVLPLAIRAYYQYLSGEVEQPYRALLWGTLVSVFDPHGTVLLAFIGGIFTVVHGFHSELEQNLSTVKRVGFYCVGFVLLNSYWILPVVTNLTGGNGTLSAYSIADLTAFSAYPTIDENILLSVMMLYGFWRPGYLTTTSVLPTPLVFGLFTLLLALLLYGVFISDDKSWRDGLFVSAICCFILAMGATGPVTGPVVTKLFETVPGLLAMRDTQKFSIGLCLAYAWFSGVALDELIRDSPINVPSVSRDSSLRVGLSLVILVATLSYSLPMLNGFHGQLSPTEYPDSWNVLNERLTDDPTPSRVLVFPWHQYMMFSFTDRTIANPTDIYFDKPVLRGRNIEIGTIESNAPEPAHQEVRSLLAMDWRDRSGFGEATAPLGVRYIVLFKSADYESYSYLNDQTDLRIQGETTEYVLYENTAFDGQQQDAWPAKSSPIPMTAVLVGFGLSLLTLLSISIPVGRRILNENSR
ncbi:hypothetical protein [Haloferax sp. ATB1]|uniref:hypothetical protein n=1 Tax=Haloferax sp. ATB1 TaxID=1508454 RepID=UPI0005B2277A|nr:hypothetical protein [Haloferax sp. ATB1]